MTGGSQRHEPPVSWRSNAVDPGFQGVWVWGERSGDQPGPGRAGPGRDRERTGTVVAAIVGSGDHRGVHLGPELRLRRGQPAVPHRRRMGRRGGAGRHLPAAAERHLLRRAVGPDPAGLGRRARGKRRGPAVRLPHRRGRGHRPARPARDARGYQGPGDPPGRRAGPAALGPIHRSVHRPARDGRGGAGRCRAAGRGPDPFRPGQPGSAGRHSRAGRSVPAAQRGWPAARDERAVHHGHHVPLLPAGHLVRGADRGRERLRALVPQPPGRPRGRGDRAGPRRIRPEPDHREVHPVGRAVHGAGHRADRRPAVQVGRRAAGHAGLRRHRVPDRGPGGGLARRADGRHPAA